MEIMSVLQVLGHKLKYYSWCLHKLEGEEVTKIKSLQLWKHFTQNHKYQPCDGATERFR